MGLTRLSGLVLLLGILGLSRLVLAANFCLVRDGKPAATIVVAADPRAAASFAAAELQYHIQKITGTLLPVVADVSPVKGSRILVGDSAATAKLGLAGSRFKDQEYLIRFLPDTLVLLGKDGSEPPQTNVSLRGEVQWTEGRFGKALEFNGTNAALTVGDCGFRDEEGALEAWVKLPSQRQLGENTILRLDGAAPWTYHILRRVPDANRIGYLVYDGANGRQVTSGELTPGWHHVMATWSAAAGRFELFVDAASQGTARYVKTTCRGASLHVGGTVVPEQETPSNPFRGAIDEVRVSTICRKPDPGASAGPCQPDESTAFLLHLDEGEGTPADARGLLPSVAPPVWCDDQGTSYAVHDFLERFCDVRWFGPTELGMVCPKSAVLTVAPREVWRAPAFAYRVGGPRMPMPLAKALWNNPTYPEIVLFWARLRCGGQRYGCNHSFYGYYDRFWEKSSARPELFVKRHADWFARGYEDRPPQMCFASEGFIQQAVQDARDYFDGKPKPPGTMALGSCFALAPMDNNAWCKCRACQAQLDPRERKNLQFNNGTASDYVFGFVNRVAREVRKTHPDKCLSTIAYHDYAYYPKKTVLEPNVSVQMCLTVRHWWAPSMEKNDLNVYRAWVSREKDRRPLYLWLYYCFPELVSVPGKFHCFPGFSAHTAARQIKTFAADGIRGAYLDGIGEHADTYVTFKLLDDPTLDVDKLLDEFFTRSYGAAAGPLKRIYLRIEEIYSNPNSYPREVQTENRLFHQTAEIAWRHLGTPERMQQLGKWMAEARQAKCSEEEKQRVGLFEKAIWSYMVEGRRLYAGK